MSRIFCGDKASVDAEIFELVKTLPDEYWVFAGFSIGREVDWFIAKESAEEASAMLLVELKRSDRSIKATSQDTVWDKETPQGWEPMDSERDLNPYWQAVNTANTLKTWLWNNQRHIMPEAQTPISEDSFAVWPEVLILSPPGLRHYLPLRPTSRFGAWFTNADHWIQSVRDWRPKKGIALSGVELGRIAGLLGLQRAWPPADGSAPVTVAPAEQVGTPELFAQWLSEMSRTVTDLQRRLDRLERLVGAEPD